MTDLHKQITDALAGLAQRHNIGAGESQPAPVRREYPAPAAPVRRRPAAIDQRDSLAALRTDTRKQAVSPADRHKYEGRYADAPFVDGYATVLVHTVEWKAGAVRAYVMRMDKRTREYVTLDKLTNLRDED